MTLKKSFPGALISFLFLSGLAVGHSSDSSHHSTDNRQISQGSGPRSYSPMPSQGSGTKQSVPGKIKKSSGGMDGCNVAIETGWLGLEVINLDKNAYPDVDSGVLVKGVMRGGPAETAGIKSGDIIMTLNGKIIKSVDQLENSVMGFPLGYNAELGIKSGNQRKNLTVKVEKRKSMFAAMPMMSGRGNMPGNLRPGMFFDDMMKRSPMGKMQQGGFKPGPAMMFGNNRPSSTNRTGSMGMLSGSDSQTVSLDEPARSTYKHDIISRYIHFEKKLNLSPDQTGALKKIKRGIDKAVIRLDAAIKVAQIEMDELLNENRVDMDKVENKIREIEKYRTDRSLKHIRSLTAAKNILTKEQQEKFKALSGNL